MKARTNILLIICIAVTFFSCQKVIPYTGDDKDSLLVINQIIERDSTFTIAAQRSVFFLETTNSDVRVNDASITITDLSTGVSETQSMGINGNYEFAMVAEEGKTYRMEATHSIYPSVSAETTIPALVPLISVDTVTIETVTSSGSFEKMHATLKWNDPIGVNRYLVIVKWVSPLGGFDYNFGLESNDLAISNGGGNDLGEDVYGGFFALDDASFDGQQKELKVSFYPESPGQLGEYQFDLYNCTEDAYRYIISADLSQGSGGDPFSEPVSLHTNIQGGYGIFAGMNNSRIIKYN